MSQENFRSATLLSKSCPLRATNATLNRILFEVVKQFIGSSLEVEPVQEILAAELKAPAFNGFPETSIHRTYLNITPSPSLDRILQVAYQKMQFLRRLE
jgi:hypothetical protein